ncbi:MAG: pitrilysin family protein [Neisseria sp.]
MFKRITLITCLVASSPAWAETLSHTLLNGMKVIIKEDKRAPVAVSRIHYNVGSADEEQGKTGLSHALEHLMFKGTSKVPSGEFSRRVSSLGGSDNAYTKNTATVYFETVAAKNLPEVLKMEADRMVNLNFSDKDFLNEMSVIREERRLRTEDSPSGALYEKLLDSMYQKHYNRAPVIGQMADLNTLKAIDLRRWYQQWYVPNNATLVVVGDVNATETLKTVTQLFGGLKAKPLPQRRDLNEAPRSQAATVSIEHNTRQPMFMSLYNVPKLTKINDAEPYALDMLSTVLSGNSSSRYSKKLLRGEAVALSANTYYSGLGRDNGMFGITGMPAEGVSVEKLHNMMLDEIRHIAKEGVPEAELEIIRRQYITDKIYEKDSIANQADLILTLESAGLSYRDEDEIERRNLAVTSQAIQDAAKTVLNGFATTGIVNPRSSAAEGAKP